MALRRAGRLLLLFVALNLLLFGAARALFLLLHARGADGRGVALALLYGARLDLALLAIETALLAFVCLARRSVRPRGLGFAFGVLTVLHLIAAGADLAMYGERGLHVGDPFVANVGTGHVTSEIAALATTEPLAAIGFAAGLVAAFLGGRRLARRIPAETWSVSGPRRIGATVLALPVLFAPAVQSVEFWGTDGGFDWEARLAAPRHYARLDDYRLHAALVNPLEEILVVHLPLAVAGPPPPRMEEAEAIETTRSLLRLAPEQVEYPLLREITSGADLGIDSVWIVQVEGLSSSVLERDVDGEPVMPFLRSLADEGLFFPDAVQGFNNTSGGMFCTVTGLPRTSLEESTGVFTDREIAGYFGTLPRVLGPGRDYSFYEGFRQTGEDYCAFMGSQGYRTVLWSALRDRLESEGRACPTSVLGIADGPLLEACARDLRGLDRPFVCHVMTGTTHAPWDLPTGTVPAFEDPRLATFRYFDDSLRGAVGILRADPELAARTLLVVLADHTSIVFGEDWIERFRIPILFHHPRLAERGFAGRRGDRATEVDVLPTVLDLMGGRHRWAGTGRSLLAPGDGGGVMSGTRTAGLYFRGDLALEWSVRPEDLRVYGAADGRLGARDLAAERPEDRARLEREFFSLYEAVRRLSQSRRIFPPESAKPRGRSGDDGS
jgi:hypothetical protein